ncbi:MAG: hypothetical protein Q9207_000658 [Kuettlingeria erythrocarpa]
MVTSASRSMILRPRNGICPGRPEEARPPRLQWLGQRRLLIPPSLLNAPGDTGQTAKRRKNVIQQLVKDYPEIAPASALLPPWAEESEVIQDSTAQYDPAVSDILAFGRAYHPRHHRNGPKNVPVAAIPGGAAGEFIRVIQLIPEIVGWGEGSDIQLRDNFFQTRVQGLWCGNGRRIEQLQFAQLNDEPTEWLAVRYGGNTSILRVILRAAEVPSRDRTFRLPAIEENAELCIELKQIVTVSMQRSGGAPHATMCFNPWNSRQFAVVDQASHWTIWTIRSINTITNVWTVDAGASGYLVQDPTGDDEDSASSESKFDGWGAADWVGNGTFLIVCNRRRIGCFESQDPSRPCRIPDLGLENTRDWILDVKKAPTNPSFLFIATSSRVFLLRLTSEYVGNEDQPQLDAKILLSWAHFRNEFDGYMVATSSGLRHPTGAPQILNWPQPARKSPYKIEDDFIRPDGILSIEAQGSQPGCGPSQLITAEAIRPGYPSSERSQISEIKPHVTPSQDQWTTNLEWLIDQLSSTLTIPFDEALRLVWSRVSNADISGLETLDGLVDSSIGLGDIEEDSEALENLLHHLNALRSGGLSGSENLPEEGITISQLALPSLPSCLQAGSTGSLTQTYDALITSWITCLATNVPGRVRTGYGRMIRGIAAELQLASLGVRLRTMSDQVENQSQGVTIAEQTPIDLPVRSIPTFSQESRRVQAKAIEQASAHVASSQTFADQGLHPATGLPTPERTPSLRSQGSGGSRSTREVGEDPTVQRLRAYVGVVPRPFSLGAKARTLLNHWSSGQNPQDYDWERAKEHLEGADEPEVAEEAARAKKRRRKERSVEKRRVENTAAYSSSLTIPVSHTGSQTEMPSGPEYSSQPTLVTASQPLPGPHGGAIKAKKGRKKGF